MNKVRLKGDVKLLGFNIVLSRKSPTIFKPANKDLLNLHHFDFYQSKKLGMIFLSIDDFDKYFTLIISNLFFY